MLVKDWMTQNVITVNSDNNMQDAIKLMLEHRISVLPVLEKAKLVGIVTDRDLKRAGPSDVTLLEIKHILYHLAKVPIRSIMSRKPITVSPHLTLVETASVLRKNKISGCPVLDDRARIVGIITKNDILDVMIAMIGRPTQGVQFGFLLEDRPGSIKEITDVIRTNGGRIASIMSSYGKAPQGYRHTYVRAFDLNQEGLSLVKPLVAAKAKLLYVVDMEENEREIFDDA
jgi:acetoin utilization protein AcuB